MCIPCKVYNKTYSSYPLMWSWQKYLLTQKQNYYSLDPQAVLILTQHEEVYTLGSISKNFPSALQTHRPPVYRIDRGGEVTYHAPGQLVGYLLIDLSLCFNDLHYYIEMLQESIINTLATYGIICTSKQGFTGVWHQDTKIAFIGIKVSKWITLHGFSINFNLSSAGFESIVPCGIPECKVTTLTNIINETNMKQLKSTLIYKLADKFNLEMYTSH